MARALTVGEGASKQANGLMASGKTDEAVSAFERLRKEYPATWIDRRSEERLAKLQGVSEKSILGSTGDPPVASGDSPDERLRASLTHRSVGSVAAASAIPVGEP